MTSPEKRPDKSDKDRPLAPWARALLRGAFKTYVLFASSKEDRQQHLRTGLIQGAIIGAALCRPHGETLKYCRAPGGLWLGYDFNRPQVFPEAYNQGKTSSITKRLTGMDKSSGDEPSVLTSNK